MEKLKKSISIALCLAMLVLSMATSAFAATGRSYSDSFTTTSSVSKDTHLYGYRDIKMRADGLWSNSGDQKFTVRLNVKDGSSYKGLAKVSCNTATSGGTYIWKNANTNTTLSKPAYFTIEKSVDNGVKIGGTIVSWSQQ